jgi:hypothetical protein
MSRENPTWGPPRNHCELLKLGLSIADSSVTNIWFAAGVLLRRPGVRFLENHIGAMVSMDCFTVPTVRFQVLYVFLVLAHERQRIVHFAVTAHPPAEWPLQQLRAAFPWKTSPRFLLRDRNRIFGREFVEQVKTMDIWEVLSRPRSPWQRAYVERVIGTIRRECLDHVIVFGERDLRHWLRLFIAHYHQTRTHLALGKNAFRNQGRFRTVTRGG